MRAATSFRLARNGYKTQIYASTEELLGQRHLRNGCVLLKWGMPGPDVRDLVGGLEKRGASTPVIMVGENTPATAAIDALRQGAADFLQRPYEDAELITAVERSIDRSRKLDHQRQRSATAQVRLSRLSARKRQVLQGLLAGMSNKVIAQRLALSPRTVELHRATMMEELGVDSLVEALRMAIDAELTPLDETLLGTQVSEQPADLPITSTEDAMQPDWAGRAWPLPPAYEILEGTTDCVFLLDPEWRFTYLNGNARKLLGCGDELMGIRVWDKFPLASTTRAWDELHRAAADRQATRFEFYEPDLRSWLDVSVRPYAAGLQVSFRNISRERSSSAQLQLSEQTLLNVLEATGDGSWDWNIQTGEIAMSPSFLARLGYGPRAFPQHFESFIHLVHPDDLPMVTRCLKDHLDGCSTSFRCEYRLRSSNGEWLWNLDRGRVVARDPVTALPLRMVGTASDITEIKAAQQKAEEALDRLALAQANAGVGIWELDLKSRELRFCEHSSLMHGLSHGGGTLTEEDWYNAVHPCDRDAALLKLKVHIGTGEPYRIRYRTVASDGSVRWVLGMGKAVSAGSSQPDRFVGLTGLIALVGCDDLDETTAV